MRLCKDSTNPLCHGWPGGMNAWSVSCSLAQRPTAPAINSGPLSALSAWGCSMGQDSQVKHFDHVGGSHAPLDAESQVLTGELIDNVTDLEHVPLPIQIKLEINGPHLPRRVLRELPHGHPFCPATSSQDYSEQPSQNKRSEKPRPFHGGLSRWCSTRRTPWRQMSARDRTGWRVLHRAGPAGVVPQQCRT